MDLEPDPCLGSPLPCRDPQHFPGSGHCRHCAKKSQRFSLQDSFWDSFSGEDISKQSQIILLEAASGEMKVVLWLPSVWAPISNLAVAYSHKYTYLKNYDLQPFSLKEKQFWSWRICHCLKLIWIVTQMVLARKSWPQMDAQLCCIFHHRNSFLWLFMKFNVSLPLMVSWL